MNTLRIIMMGLALVCLPVLAMAENCTSQYVTMPNGKVMLCTNCCYNGVCSTRCW